MTAFLFQDIKEPMLRDIAVWTKTVQALGRIDLEGHYGCFGRSCRECRNTRYPNLG